jgi:hypothetical protein
MYPASLTAVPPEIVEQIIAEIGRGMPNGQRFSNRSAAVKRPAWPIVRRHCPDKTENQCRAIIARLIKDKKLHEDNYDDPVYRKPQSGLFASEQEKKED